MDGPFRESNAIRRLKIGIQRLHICKKPGVYSVCLAPEKIISLSLDLFLLKFLIAYGHKLYDTTRLRLQFGIDAESMAKKDTLHLAEHIYDVCGAVENESLSTFRNEASSQFPAPLARKSLNKQARGAESRELGILGHPAVNLLACLPLRILSLYIQC